LTNDEIVTHRVRGPAHVLKPTRYIEVQFLTLINTILDPHLGSAQRDLDIEAPESEGPAK
jgi:hypothetical protein